MKEEKKVDKTGRTKRKKDKEKGNGKQKEGHRRKIKGENTKGEKIRKWEEKTKMETGGKK